MSGASAMRAGWWSAVSPAPPAPDVPADGLHVAGGAQGPSAIAAVAFELPEGARATTLAVELTGVSPRTGGLQACLIPADAAGFAEAQNGAWADRPAYDCDAGAAPATVDGASVSFDVGALQRGSTLAVALVPGATDRASFARPEAGALQALLPAPPSEPKTVTATAPSAAPVAGPPAPTPLVPSPALTITPAVTIVQPTSETPFAAASTPTFAAATSEGDQPTRTRVGGAIGFALLLVVLLFYSQGRGLLGARVGGQ